jgi:hypothetical protein
MASRERNGNDSDMPSSLPLTAADAVYPRRCQLQWQLTGVSAPMPSTLGGAVGLPQRPQGSPQPSTALSPAARSTYRSDRRSADRGGRCRAVRLTVCVPGRAADRSGAGVAGPTASGPIWGETDRLGVGAWGDGVPGWRA